MDLIRFANLLRRDLGISISLVELFEAGSLHKLAARIEVSYSEQNARLKDERDKENIEEFPNEAIEICASELKAEETGVRNDLASRVGIQLIQSSTLEDFHSQVILASSRKFSLKPIPFESFGTLLGELHGVDGKFRYGSASGLYSVQTYCSVKPGRVEGVLPGLYYYHPMEHRLIEILADAQIPRETFGPRNRTIYDSCGFAIFLICRLSIVRPIYGKFAINLTMYEAGSMGQLLRGRAAMLDLGLCSVGSVASATIREMLGLDEQAVLLHTLVGGKLLDLASRTREVRPDPTPLEQVITLTDRLLELSDSEARFLQKSMGVGI